jgi:CRISPR-associated protein Cst2
MTYPVLTAAVLIEANGAALNNAGSDPDAGRLGNAVVVKQIRIGRTVYPYISGQAVRRWWRETLYADFGWTPSPVTREAKSAYTLGDPVAYADDDLFGYMAAKKAPKKAKAKAKDAEDTTETTIDDTGDATKAEAEDSGGTQRRVSPLKNSLLVSVLPNVITTDFGHFSRDLPVEDPRMVPFEHQHYSATMQGVFTISLTDVGRFECGAMRDVSAQFTSADASITATEVQKSDGLSKPRVLALSLDVRRKRVAEVIEALGRLRYGANLTRNLSDVSPVVILGGYLDGGNAPFQNLFTPDDNGQVQLNLKRLGSVLKDYGKYLLGSKTLYFGYRPGVLSNEEETLKAFESAFEGISVQVGTPGEILQKIASEARTGNVIPEVKG